MKIAVASEDQIHVSGHLGRCRGFMIFEIENEEVKNKEYRENTFTNHMINKGAHNHGEGHGHGHGRLVAALSDCESLIFSSGGSRVIADLESANIKPVLTDEPIAKDAVNKFIKNELVIKEESGCSH